MMWFYTMKKFALLSSIIQQYCVQHITVQYVKAEQVPVERRHS